ncbi:unnamed protein product [Clavelina lepadiformis]|uniref:Nucleolar protein 10 n=1 Tax=Clavelina lepadiformis TaxID=159417 RepID=A0ABP0H1I7_CLALP
MQVSNPNNIKIYNLSCGKSLPEFISDKRKRSLLKKDDDLRRRIELIQDFEMPTVSSNVKMSPDQQYIFATGTYKPRVRCYDVKDLSLKFERCLDAEVVKFDVLSEDYSKLVFLLNDRTVELHTQQGRHYTVRIPKFGRDLAYHPANCDLMLVGAGSEVYRLNLDQGRFLKSFETQSPELNVCTLNEFHHLLITGGIDGRIECWDPRSKCRAGILDCNLGLSSSIMEGNGNVKVSSLKFKGPLHMAVGTSTGHVLLYDIRSQRPYIVKDHRYDLPIHSIDFNEENNMVISSDARAVKFWNETTGEAVTAVELESDINDLHVVKGTGLFFLANESPKIRSYFIPMLGPAPKWCLFLDNLTEELEENPTQEMYDDYKFLTQKDVANLGLTNLVGTSLLKAYMHGYFVDMRLYHKALSIANPFAYKEYRKKKIADKIEEARENRVKLKKLPKVNRNLADRLLSRADEEEPNSGKKKKMKKEATNLLSDPRFKAMFEDPSFQVDEESEEFKLLNPVVSKQFEKQISKKKTQTTQSDDEQNQLSDDDQKEGRKWIAEAKSEHKLKKKRIIGKSNTSAEPRMFEIKSDKHLEGNMFATLDDLDAFYNDQIQNDKKRKINSLEERIEEEENEKSFLVSSKNKMGGKEATFRIKKENKEKTRSEDEKKHREERRQVRRPAQKLQRQRVRKTPFFK